MWDGSAVPARMFTQSQTTLSAPVGAKTEREERIKEPNSEKGENMEQVSNLQYSETNVEFGSKMTKVEEEELEIKNVTCQDRVEDPQQTDWEPKLGSQLGCLPLQDYIPKTTHPVQEAITSPSLEESAAPSDHRLQQTTSTVEKQDVSWDTYDFLVPGFAKNSQLPFGFASPNTATHPVGVECEQPYLHIPARPVITQAMPHPPLLFNHGYCQFPLSKFEGDQKMFRYIILLNWKVKYLFVLLCF